jgi:hypothetical protein
MEMRIEIKVVVQQYSSLQMLLMTADNFFVITIAIYGGLKFLFVETGSSFLLFINYSVWIFIYGSVMATSVVLGDFTLREV